MNGTFMLMAFVVGFWGIWSANRDPNSLMEGLGITIIAIVAKAIMEWNGVPSFAPVELATWGVMWVFTVAVIELVGRYSVSMGVNLSISVGGAVGWYFLAEYIFGASGQALLKNYVG